MIRKIKPAKENIFQRKNVQDLTVDNYGSSCSRSVRGVNPMHAGVSLLMIILGSFSVYLAIINYAIYPRLASLLSLLGSLTVIIGAWFLYETFKERKSVDKLVKDAILRVIRDKN